MLVRAARPAPISVMRDGPRDVLPVSSEVAEPEAGGIGAPVERDVMDPRYGGAGVGEPPHAPSARARGGPPRQRAAPTLPSPRAGAAPPPRGDARGGRRTAPRCRRARTRIEHEGEPPRRGQRTPRRADQETTRPGGIGRTNPPWIELLPLGGLARSATFGRRPLRTILDLALPVLGAPHLLQVTTSHAEVSLSVVVVAALRKLLAALLGRVDRVQECRPHARFFQVADRFDRGPAR